MDKDEQRIAIAEACGWTDISNGLGYDPLDKREYKNHQWLPDYLSDLNAMHEAETTLELPGADTIQVQLNAYAQWLQRLSIAAGNHYTFQATAAQRAEAFLRTLGLWKE
jgi:hypothetical protein